VRRSFLGHYWTVQPHLRRVLRPVPAPRDEKWDATVRDPHLGALRLTGWLRRLPHSEACVVLVHGLGGSADSRYMIDMAHALDEANVSYLRLNLRGADRSGEDVYHAGLTDDVRAALASPALARFSSLYLIGFSMGGHVALRWASEPDRDPRVRAIASVCAPLDLEYEAYAIQRPFGRPYQWHVLNGLKEIYWAAALRRRMPIPVREAMELKTIMEWDDAVIAPRFGFNDHRDYYRRMSASSVISSLDLPTLFVAAEDDPMVTAGNLRPWLAAASPAIEVAWASRGGHIGFPRDVDLGFGAKEAIEPQIVRWLARH
jgi:uncharacterized protein